MKNITILTVIGATLLIASCSQMQQQQVQPVAPVVQVVKGK